MSLAVVILMWLESRNGCSCCNQVSAVNPYIWKPYSSHTLVSCILNVTVLRARLLPGLWQLFKCHVCFVCDYGEVSSKGGCSGGKSVFTHMRCREEMSRKHGMCKCRDWDVKCEQIVCLMQFWCISSLCCIYRYDILYNIFTSVVNLDIMYEQATTIFSKCNIHWYPDTSTEKHTMALTQYLCVCQKSAAASK